MSGARARRIRLIAFTEKGYALARRLAEALPGEASRCGQPLSLSGWVRAGFAKADALVFVGAAGIAVRAVAPCLQGKAVDPAVVVVDECARFAVPVLSGHLGGANDLARRIGGLTGAVPVITTATDANGRFAVDEWARRQGCAVANPERIKAVSAKVLAGGTAVLGSRWPVAGEPPPGVAVQAPSKGEQDPVGCDFLLTLAPPGEPGSGPLHLIPRIAVLGVGCRRGTPKEAIDAACRAFLAANQISELALASVCSIDRKADEPGLAAFCAARGLPFVTFSADELQAAQGAFTPSAFVRSVTGVDNVCERAAVLGSGGHLYVKKTAGNGVTLAMALAPFAPDWRWTDE